MKRIYYILLLGWLSFGTLAAMPSDTTSLLIQSSDSVSQSAKPKRKWVSFSAYNNESVTFSKQSGFNLGPAANFEVGMRLLNYAFFGIGAEVHTKFNFNAVIREQQQVVHFDLWLPIYGVVKAMYPISEHFSSLAEVCVGGSVFNKHYAISTKGEGLSSRPMDTRNGLYFRIGAGVEYRKCSYVVGYDLNKMSELDAAGAPVSSSYAQAFYFRFGVRFL